MARRGICVCADRNSICDLDDKQNQTLIPWCFPHTGAKNIAHKLLVHAAEEDEKDEEPVTDSQEDIQAKDEETVESEDVDANSSIMSAYQGMWIIRNRQLPNPTLYPDKVYM